MGPLGPTSATSIWFEIWGSWIQVKKLDFPGKFPKNFNFFRQFHKKFNFSRQIFEKFQFFQAISQKIRFFQANFRKISMFSGSFTNNFDFPGKNWLFTATSGQIILFLFKSYHFRIYFLYIIRYNISRPVHDPHGTLPKIWGSRPQTLKDGRPCLT